MKKRILYVSTHPHLNLAAPSGPGTHMREVIKAFRDEGYEVHTFIAGGEEMEPGQTAIRFSKKSWKKFIPKLLWESLKEWRLLMHNQKMMAQLQGAILNVQPDFIYERGYAFMTAGVELANRNDIPIFLELNAPYPEEIKAMSGSGVFSSFTEIAEKKQSRLASQIIVVSSAMKDYFERKHNVSSEKIIVTPNAVNLSFLDINQALRESMISKFNGNRVIGFVGSIFPYHGVDKLIKSFASVVSKHSHLKAKLLIVGDGEVLAELQQLAIDLNVSSEVIFTGNVPHKDVSTYISLMDVTVMADSNWYGSPVKIFEYGLFGKYIIAPNTQPVRDVMEDKKHGWLLKNSDEDLVSALEFSLQSSEECKRAGEAFESKVKNEHLWKHVGASIISKIS